MMRLDRLKPGRSNPVSVSLVAPSYPSASLSSVAPVSVGDISVNGALESPVMPPHGLIVEHSQVSSTMAGSRLPATHQAMDAETLSLTRHAFSRQSQRWGTLTGGRAEGKGSLASSHGGRPPTVCGSSGLQRPGLLSCGFQQINQPTRPAALSSDQGKPPGVSSNERVQAAAPVWRLVLGTPGKPFTVERAARGSDVPGTLVPPCPTDVYPPGLVPALTKGSLFIGSLKHALDEALLKKLGVKLVVTVAWPYGEWPSHQRSLYSRLRITHINHPLLDSPSQALDFAHLSLARIHTYLSRGATVLVHCEKGISRSASLCAAYLIVYHGHTASSALAAIRKYRPIARPNQGFLLQLRRLEDSRQAVANALQASPIASSSRSSSSSAFWPSFRRFPIFPLRSDGADPRPVSPRERVVIIQQGVRRGIWEK
ncbi:dual specificity phosphatase, catalytic domain-containing protein [Besnoitia besnoiti]|uniref:protein-tyrosine-phosphatase n=1 Tax=Besnoitia besnoiti TaxID=94643 RepID=A0A2A9MEL1_BESBE|nr:dual specificity phosphatase, catalytic domain-containing protein [Besnoitia besnoiti]PFH33820.1 dual specificity phosphatase, catalytic domain-containing protein [Besnoitia besnoiti]